MYNDDYFVSVIIPNYCHSKFLDERIQSILGQTYQNFELIILDDCSPDDGASRAIIEQYRDNPHVSHIIYNNVNSGSALLQWDKGIGLAKGEIIWIAESDDSSDRSFLEKMLRFFFDEEVVMAFCKSLFYDVNGGKTDYKSQAILRNSFVLKGSDFIKNCLKQNIVANASGALFRKSVASSVSPIYKSMKAVGDWMFWILLAEKGKVAFLNECLNFFRTHDFNSTPKYAINGISFKEQYVIYRYKVDAGYYNGLYKYWFCLAKVSAFENKQFESEELKKEIMNLWDKNHIYIHFTPIYRFLNHILRLIRKKGQ